MLGPSLENSSAVWNPHTQTQIHKLEVSQCYVLHRQHNVFSVTGMLQILVWMLLAYSRADAKLCVMYKIVNGIVGIPSNQ